LSVSKGKDGIESFTGADFEMSDEWRLKLPVSFEMTSAGI
jgi:hypothetical protein